MIFASSKAQRTWLLITLGMMFLQACGGGGSSPGAATPTPPPASASAPSSWSISCFDNQCVDITDQRLVSGQSFIVSTSLAGGTTLGTYTLIADSADTIVLRPSSYAELASLNQSAGLTVSISPSNSGASGFPIQFAAFKTVTSFSHGLIAGQLTLNLNTNSTVQSSAYSIDFLDSNQTLLQSVTGITPSNSTLAIDAASLQSNVMAAYNGGGIYVRLTNSQHQALPGAYYTNATDIGALDDFYDASQLQGQFALFDQGLVDVQANLGYLSASNVDVPYVSRFAKEIPFAHTLSITRFLGGYTPSDVQQFCSTTQGASQFASYCAPTFHPWSLDYVVENGSSTTYQTALMLERLTPYIDAGYSPSDMTLVLINVPWTISSSVGPRMAPRVSRRAQAAASARGTVQSPVELYGVGIGDFQIGHGPAFRLSERRQFQF